MRSKAVVIISFATSALAGTPVSIKPHPFFSSWGVLGCKININRVAYWPFQPDCNKPCIKLTASNGNSLHVLHIDKSGGSYDISYDAWNYLSTGVSATVNPTYGGAIQAEYESVSMDNCKDIIKTSDGSLPVMAGNPDPYTLCPPGTWSHDHVSFWNFGSQDCSMGVDEQCTMPPGVGSQAQCPTFGGASKVNCAMRIKNLLTPGAVDVAPAGCPAVAPRTFTA
ncbi:hypothetical protein BDV96DRAFT_646997 [Lophiotrema nucula]|uniref:Uncharacterized protein n=1 Tax=Lophiotrema nucula TaxID=690887 RepID=A0A6A5Z9T6_9PLEO|nr:hypothetical protein BDV96DRAFT_646997 [Lophiotrema nucula]